MVLCMCRVCRVSPVAAYSPVHGLTSAGQEVCEAKAAPGTQEWQAPGDQDQIAPPIPLKQWKEQQEPRAAAINLQVPSSSIPPPAITDDGTEFTRSFLSRGRGTSTVPGETAKDRILKRLASTQAGQTKAQRVDTTDMQASSTTNASEECRPCHPVIGSGNDDRVTKGRPCHPVIGSGIDGPAEEQKKRKAPPLQVGRRVS